MSWLSILALTACVALGGCGRGTVPAAQPQDPEFAPYVADFVAAAKARGHDLAAVAAGVRIEFGEPEAGPGHGAGCSISELSGPRTITVRRSLWDSEPPYDDRAVMIFHELGHCVLNRGHRDDLSDEMPVSIMHSRYVSGDHLHKQRDRLLDELFEVSP